MEHPEAGSVQGGWTSVHTGGHGREALKLGYCPLLTEGETEAQDGYSVPQHVGGVAVHQGSGSRGHALNYMQPNLGLSLGEENE